VDHELHQAAARLKQLAASRLSSLVSLPTLDEATGSLAAFEPAIRAMEILVSETFQEGDEPNLLTALISSEGNPSRPLVEALIRQGRTSQGTSLDVSLVGPAISSIEGDAIPQTPKPVLEITNETLSPIATPLPQTTPRTRHVPARSTPKKTPAQRKQPDPLIIPSTPQSRRQRAAEALTSTPQSPVKSPVAMKKLPTLLPYPAPGEHVVDNAMGTSDTVSVASSSRKRKRSDYEVPVLDVQTTGNSSKAVDGEETVLDGKEQTNGATVDLGAPTPPASQKRTRKQSGREANRIKREKERMRRGERIWGYYLPRVI
jgi:hypothetical protein